MPSSAPPTPTSCSARSTRSPPATSRAALRGRRRGSRDSGRDLGRFFGDLEAHARALMVVQALGELPAELRVTPEQDERLAAQAKSVSPVDVVRLLDLIAAALRAMKDGADARTQLDLVLVKAAEPAHDPSTKALLARLERLEGRAPAPAPAARPGRARHRAGRTRVAVGRDHDAPTSAAARARGQPRGRAARPRRRRRSPRSPSSSRTASSRSRRSPSCGRLSLESLEGESPRLAAILQEARPTSLADQDLTLALARVGRVLQAPGRGPGEARADRPVDPRRHRRLLRLAYELAPTSEQPVEHDQRGRAGRSLQA